jgi:hypothetical protein
VSVISDDPSMITYGKEDLIDRSLSAKSAMAREAGIT